MNIENYLYLPPKSRWESLRIIVPPHRAVELWTPKPPVPKKSNAERILCFDTPQKCQTCGNMYKTYVNLRYHHCLKKDFSSYKYD
jgi:hypothetical protein